ncbi:hypothetical protein [Halorussus halobius]|uniref:hypothetical protein n=1 Tax=Halorussus halobius TaxID=1710537 RepID=UPI001091E3E1|nr:hypothetical protein [Halorussus halobius]
MMRKTAKLGLAALVLLAGLTATGAAADAPTAQDVENDGATQIDVVTSDNSCPVQIESDISLLCGGGGGGGSGGGSEFPCIGSPSPIC